MSFPIVARLIVGNKATEGSGNFCLMESLSIRAMPGTREKSTRSRLTSSVSMVNVKALTRQNTRTVSSRNSLQTCEIAGVESTLRSVFRRKVILAI